MTQRRVVLLLRAAAAGLAVFALVAFPSAAAAEGDASAKPASITKLAWYTAKTSNALPQIIFHEFPPGLGCLVVPESCTDQAKTLTAPVDGVVKGISVPGGPVQPVVPGTVPIGLLGGKLRYATVFQFDPGEQPENSTVGKFDLLLHEDGASYALESPAFRGLVRAAITQYKEPGPDAFESYFNDVTSQKAAFAEVEPTGIEACPVTGEWVEGENQEATKLPERDCAFGANGVRSADGTWTFDLSVMAQAWAEGILPNRGVYVGPAAAQNLEYGDPDISTNFLVSLGGKDAAEATHPALRVSYVDVPPPIDDGGDVSPPDPGPVWVGDPIGTSDVPAFVAPPGVNDYTPAVRSPVALGPTVPVGKPYIPARMWLAFPLGLVAAVLFARGLGADVEPAVAHGGGALTRLTGGRA